MNNFLFLGGDLRSVYAAKRLSERYDCFIYGFDNVPAPVCNTPVLREITKFKSLVLPLPSCRDGININAPYSRAPLPLSVIPEAVDAGGTVYCGKSCPEIAAICDENNLTLVDYFEREELIIMNAMATAEGTLEILIREQPLTIFGSLILLTGFGRISKVLAKYLTALGAIVTVTARKYSDLAWAEIAGCKTLHLSELDSALREFDTVINTVPSPLFDTEKINRLKTGCLFIDLASESSVEEPEKIKREHINFIHALSIPGKSSPVTAGYIVADTIINILSETTEHKNTGGNSNA